MAYNSYPLNYQPMYYQPQPTQPQNLNNSNLIWVQGEAGAKSYLVAPNNTVTLWDSESQTIYLKSADASGMPSMKVLDYTIREQAPVGQGMPTLMQEGQYVTKDELSAFEKKIMDMIKGGKDDEPAI